MLVGTGLREDKRAVAAMSRSGNPGELLRGPLYYTLVLFGVTALYWRTSPVGERLLERRRPAGRPPGLGAGLHLGPGRASGGAKCAAAAAPLELNRPAPPVPNGPLLHLSAWPQQPTYCGIGQA